MTPFTAVTRLRYGNTNTFYLAGGLLVDTDTAGTLPAFFRAIKSAGIALTDISFAMATHYHPDHCGLLGELQGLGVRLLVLDVQLPYVHFADALFARGRGVRYTPPDERRAQRGIFSQNSPAALDKSSSLCYHSVALIQ